MNFLFEARIEEINAKKIIVVKDATFEERNYGALLSYELTERKQIVFTIYTLLIIRGAILNF